ncbi:hypothetical protein [Bradyrhizobium sp. USDA 4473]
MLVRQIHRGGAAVLGLFIVTHLAVHLTALWGPNAHIAALDAVQWIYRNPVGEAVLILAILLQIWTGFRRFRFSGQSRLRKVQAISGAYLAYFLLVHAGAALATRGIFHVDTNFYWAAGSLHYDPIRWGFALYYAAAIVAVFVHLGVAARFRWPDVPRPAIRTIPIAGAVLAAAILPAFWGAYYTISIPPATQTYFRSVFGFLGVKP